MLCRIANGVQEKKNHYLCEGEIEKSVPPDQRLLSLDKPGDANWLYSGWIFLSHPHHNGFLSYHMRKVILLP